MKLILAEMKKIFSFKKIVILLVINVLLFYMCIDKQISGLTMKPYFSTEHSIMVDFIKRNGSTMQEDNLRMIESMHNDYLEKVNKIINKNQEFKGMGINDYNDLSRAEYDEENFDTNKVKNLKKKYLENTDVYNEFCVLGNCISKYRIANGNVHIANVDREERMKEIQANKSYESILPFRIFDTYNDIVGNLGICSVICVVIILLPAFRVNKSNDSNGVSKRKIVAGILSSFIITTCQAFIVLVDYLGNDIYYFYGSNINSALNGLYWVDITFIQYILITVLLLYVVTTAMSLITMFISSRISNIAMNIVVMIPVLVIIMILIKEVLIGDLFILAKPKYLALVGNFAIVLISVIFAVLLCKKKKIKCK